MDIESIFQDYCAKLAQVHTQRKLIEVVSQREITRLSQHEQHLQSEGKPSNDTISAQNMSFHSAITGKRLFYGQRSSGTKDLIEAHVVAMNRQYQWLLVEAYELFEDYLQYVYAFTAFVDTSSWPLRDFGQATIDELPTKTFDWYLEQSHNKKEQPYSIMNRLRIKYPNLASFEQINELKKNLLLAVVLIEKMRHQIVHARGVVSDPNVFREKILKQAGLFNNGAPSAIATDFLRAFLHLKPGSNTILLLNIGIEPIGSLQMHYDLFEITTNFLLSYAELVKEAVSGKLT